MNGKKNLGLGANVCQTLRFVGPLTCPGMRAAKPFHCLVLSGVPGFRCRAPSYIAATNDNSTAHSQQVSHRRGISRTVSKKEKGISPSHPRDSRPLRYQGAYQPPASRTNHQSFAQGLRKKQQKSRQGTCPSIS